MVVMLKVLDVILSLSILLISAPIWPVVLFIGWLELGSPMYFQERVGQNKKPFTLIKFRSMPVGTQSIATHLNNSTVISAFGKFLRRSKLDEIPQLINVLKGEMSLVGPRPGLFSQLELIQARSEKGVYSVKPGITGLAQIKGIDMSQPNKLSEVDAKMINEMNVKVYLKILALTFLGKGRGDVTEKNNS